MGGNEPDHKDSFDASRAVAIMSFGVVVIVIGVPVWWQSTTTYRASLPYDAIDKLANTQLFFVAKLEVVVHEDLLSKKHQLSDFREALTQKFEENSAGIVKEVYHINVRIPKRDEAQAYQSTSGVRDLNAHLCHHRAPSPGQLVVYLLPKIDSASSEKAKIYIGRCRLAYLTTSSDFPLAVEEVHHMVQNVMMKSDALQKTVTNVKKPLLMKPDKATMRAQRTSPEYDITFSLVNPQPSIIRANWRIREAIAVYLEPMLMKLSAIAEFNVKSQILYLTSLGVQPGVNKDSGFHYLTQEQLPHVINPVESKLGSHVAINPILNFLVFIPSRDQHPLHIVDKAGQVSATNAFLSPRWGGILIYNVDSPINGSQLSVNINMQKVMGVFLAQLRLLLGLNMLVSNPEIEFDSFDNTSIADWELDYLYRRRTLENLAMATSTLRSLAQLLGEISNIVINNEVANHVLEAVDATETSLDLLSEGDILGAFLSSKQSYVSSEKAFFDSSMLALLYFPDDQKYAVYVPLFVPVAIPVLVSFMYLRKLPVLQRLKKHKAE